jgi:C1A family cysteine protease
MRQFALPASDTASHVLAANTKMPCASLRVFAATAGSAVLASLLLVTAADCQTVNLLPQRHATGARLASPGQVAGFSQAQSKRGLTPVKVDLSSLMPPIGDQGQQGSCVAWSVGYGLRSYYTKKVEQADTSKPENVPSPAYIYNYQNAGTGEPACLDTGMEVWQALNILKAGVVSMTDLPYNDKKCADPPSVAMQSSARKFRIDSWEFIKPDDLNTMKAELAQGNPLAMAMTLADSFQGYNTDHVYTRPSFEQTGGGHAMVIVGYDDTKQAFRVQNSWAADWGDKGFVWIAYDTFKADAEGSYAIRLWSKP